MARPVLCWCRVESVRVTYDPNSQEAPMIKTHENFCKVTVTHVSAVVLLGSSRVETNGGTLGLGKRDKRTQHCRDKRARQHAYLLVVKCLPDMPHHHHTKQDREQHRGAKARIVVVQCITLARRHVAILIRRYGWVAGRCGRVLFDRDTDRRVGVMGDGDAGEVGRGLFWRG